MRRLSRLFHQQKDTSVPPLIKLTFEQDKRFSEEKQLADELKFAENPSLKVMEPFSCIVKAHRKTQHPILGYALRNLIADFKLTADNFNVFLCRRFSKNWAAALLTIQAWSADVLEIISFTIWDGTIGIQPFRQYYSPGPDGVPISLLKAEANYIHPSLLCKVFDLAFESETLPGLWKESTILPLPKYSRSTSFDDIRPINTLPAASKTLEILIKDTMMRHLTENNLVNVAQYAILEKRSHSTCQLSFFDHVLQCRASGFAPSRVHFDFTKAFHRIEHDLLLNNLPLSG
ncbi:unnamed protein product [Dibothriocephalus latus]|uniref:Reverse transcriptase domain-containing protein n=1 Tax=Dibothriocephalus latus TaxID=60516 RepID=A0A3P7P3M0_DIBLA|nr:unnamed protein product [Dibothriocephalus latus]